MIKIQKLTNDTQIKFRDSDQSNLLDIMTNHLTTNHKDADIHSNGFSKKANRTQDRPKLLARFKLVSCKPSSFAYSLNSEEKNLNSYDRISLQQQKTPPKDQIKIRKINISIEMLLNSLAKVDGSGYKQLDQKSFLSIKPLPLNWPNSSALSHHLLKLESYISTSKFEANPYQWMLNKRLIVQPTCSNCKKNMFISDEDPDDDVNKKFWACKCGIMKEMKFPPSFSGCNSLRKVTALIYCWSTRDENTETTMKVTTKNSIDDTYTMYTSLQALCGRIISRDSTRLASFEGYPVEIASVQIGVIYILAAMETKTKAIRLAAFNKSDIIALTSNINPFIDKIRKWIAVPSQILIFEKKFQDLDSFGYILSYSTKRCFYEKKSHLNSENVGGYLIQHLQKMFKNINLNTIDPLSLQFLLNELEWREKYGYEPYTAFCNILTHLATDPLIPESVTQKAARRCFNKNSVKLDDDWLQKNNENCADSEGCLDSRLEQHGPKYVNEDQSVTKIDAYYVEEFFYGWWFPFSYHEKTSHDLKQQLNIICHLCNIHFDKANISRHLIEHFDIVQSSSSSMKMCMHQRCNHCFRNYNPKNFHSHKELLSSKLIRLSCRICCISFFTRKSFLEHMKLNHWPKEAPYVCPICRYRSSFQRDIMIHFERTHYRSKKVICPVCLMVIDYDETNQISESMYNHVSDHFKFGSFFSCSRCSLTFLSESHRATHLYHDHGDPSIFTQTSEFVPYRLTERELPFCTIATSNELDGPFRSIQRLTHEENDYDLSSNLKSKTQIIQKKRLNYRVLEEFSQHKELICMECKQKIKEKHFTQRAIFCRLCKLKTYCKIMAKKHPCAYSNRIKSRSNRSDDYQCICGNSFEIIDNLAKHMVNSKHYTCKYVGKELVPGN